MSKRITCPEYDHFEQLFGAQAADDLLTRIVEAHFEHGEKGGGGIFYSDVVKHNSLNFTYTGSLIYAGQDVSFVVSSGDRAGTEVDEFDFDADKVVSARKQVLDAAARNQTLGTLLRDALHHVQPALRAQGLALQPTPARLDIMFDAQHAAVCVPGFVHDAALAAYYPCIAQCELTFIGEACLLTVGMAALHGTEYDDELSQWASAFAKTNLVSQAFPLDAEGLLDVSLSALHLHESWSALGQADVPDGFPTLASLEHEFACSLLEACTP